MKSKKGFISISIIYSFFIVFLLLLALIMTTYINNRYSFNIYTKDEKRAHATDTTAPQITRNQLSAIDYKDTYLNYHSYYYYRITADTSENYDYTNFYYYSENKGMNIDQTFNIYVIFGPYEDHALNYTNFFGVNGSSASMAYTALNDASVIKTGKIIVVPSLNSEYRTWQEALATDEGYKDINTRLINALGTQIISGDLSPETDNTNSFIKLCQNSSSCKINVTYIGYKDGANGLFKYMGHTSSSNIYPSGLSASNYTEKYYIIDSGIICNSVTCDELSTNPIDEKTNIASKVSNLNSTGSGATATDETLKYYEKMTNVYGQCGMPTTNLSSYTASDYLTKVRSAINNGTW